MSINYRPINMMICSECGKEYNAMEPHECEHDPARQLVVDEAKRRGITTEELEREAYNAAGPEDL